MSMINMTGINLKFQNADTSYIHHLPV